MRPAPVVAAALLLSALAGTAAAQTPFVPYYGKNNIHYDTFQWFIYTTDHFEIYYYPEIEQHLERVASYAESAYQQVSADLHHDLSFKVQMILFKTHSEFEQQNVIPGAAQEGVGAFAEPFRQRMVMPLDDPPDRLYGLVVHELTHQFEFDMIPQSLIRQTVPLWVNEGLSDYERGAWTPLDLMMVRDAAVADVVPKMSQLQGYGGGNSPRLIYNLGHALFEFIEAKWGKEGIRGFIFALRKSVIGGGEDAYEEAFRMKPAEFDQAFDRYLKDRFRPFRDKERPADYGMNLAPDAERTEFIQAFTIAPSPSGDLIAVVTVNRKEQEYDILLLSAKDGSKFKNLTEGFDKDMGFSYLAIPGERYTTVHWLSWSPKGDRIAYFVRTEKERALVVQNVTNRKIEVKLPLRFVDSPESPSFSPDGTTVAFSALSGGTSDIFIVDLATGKYENLTSDDFADYAPTYSPDGKFLVYMVRVSGNQKLFKLDLDTKLKTQITFGTHDEGAAFFVDQNTIVFPSTGTDPTVPLEPDVARNGNIFNIWTLDLTTGELKQYTDALGGNLSPVVLNEGTDKRIAFVSYYKDDYEIHTLDRKEPLHTAASADFGSPGPIIDFQAPMSHSLVAENNRKKKRFEKMFLEGRPPVNLGVTSNGDVFGGTAITFGDVLGDQQFNVIASSISQYRSLGVSYSNLSRRFQFSLAGVLADAVLLRCARRRLLRSVARAARQPRSGGRDADHPGRQRIRHLPVQPLPPARAVVGVLPPERGVRRAGRAGLPQLLRTAAAECVPFRNAPPVRRRVRAGDDGLPRVRAARRQHAAPRVRLRAEHCRHAVASDLRRRRPLLSAAGHQRRPRAAFPGLQEHRASTRITCTSAATPRCAATTTCSSSART